MHLGWIIVEMAFLKQDSEMKGTRNCGLAVLLASIRRWRMKFIQQLPLSVFLYFFSCQILLPYQVNASAITGIY